MNRSFHIAIAVVILVLLPIKAAYSQDEGIDSDAYDRALTDWEKNCVDKVEEDPNNQWVKVSCELCGRPYSVDAKIENNEFVMDRQWGYYTYDGPAEDEGNFAPLVNAYCSATGGSLGAGSSVTGSQNRILGQLIEIIGIQAPGEDDQKEEKQLKQLKGGEIEYGESGDRENYNLTIPFSYFKKFWGIHCDIPNFATLGGSEDTIQAGFSTSPVFRGEWKRAEDAFTVGVTTALQLVYTNFADVGNDIHYQYGAGLIGVYKRRYKKFYGGAGTIIERRYNDSEKGMLPFTLAIRGGYDLPFIDPVIQFGYGSDWYAHNRSEASFTMLKFGIDFMEKWLIGLNGYYRGDFKSHSISVIRRYF